MKELSELGLKSKDLKKVKLWLESWVAHFNGVADNAKATVERYDLEKLDFFYFTECIDILSKNPESKGVEDNKVIIKRKRAVEYSLIFRRLLGETIGRKRPCSHCGNDDRFINSLGDGTGHYIRCLKCGMTTIVTYPVGYNTCIERMCKDLTAHGLKHGLEPELAINLDYDLKVCNTCGLAQDAKTRFTFTANQCNSCYIDECEELDKPELSKEPPLKTVPRFLEKKKCDNKCCKKITNWKKDEQFRIVSEKPCVVVMNPKYTHKGRVAPYYTRT